MQIRFLDSQLTLRESRTRLPFRYGNTCLTTCPQAVLKVTIEVAGVVATGYSGDCLPPGWFDKRPDRDYPQQIADMRRSIEIARSAYQEAFRDATPFFPTWLEIQPQIHDSGNELAFPPLLSSFGNSLLERAMIDAACRAEGLSFAAAVRKNRLGIEAGAIHPELAGCSPSDWLPSEPRQSIYVRHTVGLADPLTSADVGPDERLEDGLPQTLEEYVQRSGLKYLKVKVCNQLEADLARLREIAGVVESVRGSDYRLTLDGNEQYRDAGAFEALVEGIRREPALAQLWENVIAIEQPFERSIALAEEHTAGVRQLAATKPVIIDESDGDLEAYRRAIGLGYRGVSSKSCKGALKSILNAGLTWFKNDRGREQTYLMTGEDLCTVGIVAVQSDLCLVATLGLSHIERNGHHYHRGLSYLDRSLQDAALAAHPDFYHRVADCVAPRIEDGQFQIGSLHCPGFGFAVVPVGDAETT